MRQASAAICKITVLLYTLLISFTTAARQRPLRGNTTGREFLPKGVESGTRRSHSHLKRELSDACTGRTGSLERTGNGLMYFTVSNSCTSLGTYESKSSVPLGPAARFRETQVPSPQGADQSTAQHDPRGSVWKRVVGTGSKILPCSGQTAIPLVGSIA